MTAAGIELLIPAAIKVALTSAKELNPHVGDEGCVRILREQIPSHPWRASIVDRNKGQTNRLA